MDKTLAGGDLLKTRLTLQEKLRDLRAEQNMTLVQVEEATGIPKATLNRWENNEDIKASYQDVAALAEFYNVSTDYLFVLTDNRQFRDVQMDELRLSDEAIAVLKKGELNNRLISELMAHDDFPALIRAMEVYIDRKVHPQMNTMNAIYQFAENTIQDNFTVAEGDETMAVLQQAQVDEDEYLRYRISERFNIVIKGLFKAHKGDPNEYLQTEVVDEMAEIIDTYQKDGYDAAQNAALIMFAKKIGLNLSKRTNEEIDLLKNILQDSQKYKTTQGRQRKKKK